MATLEDFEHIPKFQNLIEEYDSEITSNATEIDGDDKEDWNSLTLGWALAKGLSIVDAQSFAFYIYTR